MTTGAHVVPCKFTELLRTLRDLSAEDLSQLDPGMRRLINLPLGRALAALALPLSGSVRVCLMNIEPVGLIYVQRTDVSARILALAVAPDMRRRGLARAMLVDALQHAKARRLGWLWMSMPAANLAGMKCALACGFRRYRPQLLRREAQSFIPSRAHSVSLEALGRQPATPFIIDWFGRELNAGDAWIAGLVESDLTPLLLPKAGRTWLCRVGDRPLGCAHLGTERSRPVVTLWLDPGIWNTPEEMWLVRAVLDTLHDPPPTFDVRLGSEGHLRASAARFKELHFTPALEDTIIFAQPVPPGPRRQASRRL